MVAPLDVYVVRLHQRVHDNVRPGTAVEDIADDVQLVYDQRFDHVGNGFDDVGSLTDLDNGVDDVFVLVLPGAAFFSQMDQLVQNLLIVRIHVGAYFGAGMLGGNMAAQVYQTVDGQAVPFLHILCLVSHQGDLGLGVVDQSCQIIPVPLSHGIAKQLFQLLLHFTGGGIQNVQEGFVFTVNIRHEMLGALGQIQHGPELDDLRTGGLDGRVLFAQQLQVVQLFGSKDSFVIHNRSAFRFNISIITDETPYNKGKFVKSGKL